MPSNVAQVLYKIYCDRSSGRSRIGTLAVDLVRVIAAHIAIVLRGDRGLEQSVLTRHILSGINCDRSSGRSRIGTAPHPLSSQRL